MTSVVATLDADGAGEAESVAGLLLAPGLLQLTVRNIADVNNRQVDNKDRCCMKILTDLFEIYLKIGGSNCLSQFAECSIFGELVSLENQTTSIADR
ncbi:hypothetical protein [Chamaesiphon sp. GL140_3_metabinner_50]|uniref:hypothetical protein n=1 Tax=Chamaesiphon sp. GL140_3_metabinner_50 TaxID=2970812 RepID=UPI0025DBB6FD|nr:hypothetical protein [Chamaesiphon sp. GL140_3_metabinner_50]